jgi:hypothetical protein
MDASELKPCWKCCGNSAIFVDHSGYFSETNKGFVSCYTFNCINERKIYTVEEWQNHDRELALSQDASLFHFLVEEYKKVENKKMTSHAFNTSTMSKEDLIVLLDQSSEINSRLNDEIKRKDKKITKAIAKISFHKDCSSAVKILCDAIEEEYDSRTFETL